MPNNYCWGSEYTPPEDLERVEINEFDPYVIDVENPGTVLPVSGVLETLAEGEEAEGENIALLAGQYRITGYVDEVLERGQVTNVQKSVLWDGEYKRVHYHKVDIIPEPDNNRTRITSVIEILDNPLPLVPIIWGLSAVATGVAGYFFVDKVQEFTTTGLNPLLLTLGTVATLIMLYRSGK